MKPLDDVLPDVRDGLTAMLSGRVYEHFYISPWDLSGMLARLGARRS